MLIASGTIRAYCPLATARAGAGRRNLGMEPPVIRGRVADAHVQGFGPKAFAPAGFLQVSNIRLAAVAPFDDGVSGGMQPVDTKRFRTGIVV